MKIIRPYLLTLFASSLIATAPGCETPDYLTESPSHNYADSYDLDIALISEWAGNIVPIDNTFNVYSVNDLMFYTNYSFNNNTFSRDVFKVDIDDLPSDLQLMSFAILNNKSESLGTISCQAINIQSICNKCDFHTCEGPDSDCVQFEDSNPFCPPICYYVNDLATNCFVSDDGTVSSCLWDWISVYECHIYTSGAKRIAQVWNELKSENTPQIRLGNGDSFGVSADVSSRFNDIPTAIMLNAMQMTTDTFGNHSFDQNLEYLQTIINTADYTYTASNLKNVPQNLNGVAPYTIVEIPKAGHDPLKLGIISALDMHATSTVYPGRFGTLDIDNYCAVIHAIESAYNDGARSFFIQAHIITDSESMIAFLNAIFSFLDDEYNSFDANHLPEPTVCKSRIIPSPDRLKKVFSKENLKDIDLNDPNNIKLYNHMILDIRKDIFNSIIGIFGEGGPATLIPFIKQDSSQLDHFYTPFEINGSTDKYASYYDEKYHISKDNLTFYSYFTSRNLMSTSNDMSHDELNSCYHMESPEQDHTSKYNKLGLSCYDYDISKARPDADVHPIWFIQIPSTASTTLQLNVSIHRNPCDNNNCPDDAFTASVNNLKQRPVVSSFLKDNTREELTEENTADLYTYKNQCTNSSSGLTNFAYCKAYFDNAKIIDQLDDLRSSNYDNYKLLMKCFDELTQYLAKDVSIDKLRSVQNTLECIYQPSAKCLTESTNPNVAEINRYQYKELPFFSFASENLFNTTSLDDRSGSTPRTSLAADAILNYYNITSSTYYHGLFFNAGAVRTRDLTVIQDSVLRELVPFSNFVVHTTMTPSALASTLQKAYYRKTSDEISYGGFPVISGLKVSKSKRPNDIQEMWLTSTDTTSASIQLTEPVFLRIQVLSGNQPISFSFTSCESKAKAADIEMCLLEQLVQQVYQHDNYIIKPNCQNQECPIAKYTIQKDSKNINQIQMQYIVKTEPQNDDASSVSQPCEFPLRLKLFITDQNGAFVSPVDHETINSLIQNDGKYNYTFALTKDTTDSIPSTEVDLNILTLDYIVNGGDGYNLTYPGINVIQTFTELDMRQIIHRYLYSSNDDICKTSAGISPYNSFTIDGMSSSDLEKVITDPRLYTTSPQSN